VSKPSLTFTQHTLPFDKLDALTFERLCLWLVRAKGYLRPEHYGLAGSEQGRDVIAYLQTEQNEELWYFQCKRYQKVDTGVLNREVDKFSQLSSKKPDLKPVGIVFVLSCSVSATIRDDVQLHCSNKGLKCEFWAHTELDMYVKEHPHLVQEFFGLQDAENISMAVQRHKPIGTIDTNVLEEANQLFASMPVDTIPELSPLPPSSRVIYSHNSLFVGREDDLLAIATTLKQGQSAVISQIVATTGLGGIGKTQLASEFVHRYGQFFAGGVFWINFANPESVPAEIGVCGGAKYLDLDPNFHKLPLETQVDLVLAAWDSPLPRLLVFDNCEDEELLVRWKRATGGCQTIITSRRIEWSVTLGVKVFPLGTLHREESVALLRSYSSNLSTVEEPVLSDIAEELGDLPLALHLAGSFLARYGSTISPSTYLSQLSRPDLLQHPSLQGRGQKQYASPTMHEQHIARTFALSYERLDASDPVDILAIKILARAAYLAHGTPIHKTWLFALLNLDEDDPENLLQAEDAIYRVLELGLLEKESEDFLRLHRLLALFVREVAADENAQTDVELTMIANAHYWNSVGYSVPLTLLEPHLRIVTEAALSREDENSARLGYELGYHLYLTGDYKSAKRYFENALELFQNIEGENGKNVRGTLNALGILSRTLGNFDAAKYCYYRVINMLEQEHEQDRYGMAAVLNNLGMLLQQQENYSEALEYYKRALVIYEDKPEKDNLPVAVTLNNIGLLLHEQGALEEAKTYYEQALKIRADILGDYHQRTAETIQNIGGIYSHQGNYELAKQYYQRALDIYRTVLREDHPDIARTLHNLAGTLKSEGDYATAKRYCKQAIDIWRISLGEVHELTLAALQDLAEFYHQCEEFDEACFYFKELLSAHEQKYGTFHQSVSHDLANLGELFAEQGDFAQAKPFYKRAVEINETLSDIDALAKALPITALAHICQYEDNSTEAIYLFKQALHLVEKKFGLHNIATAIHYRFIAELLRLQGGLSEPLSIPYYERTIEAYEVVEPIHSDYAIILNNFAVVLQNQGLYTRAQKIYEKALNLVEKTAGKQNYDYIRGLNNLAVVHRRIGNYDTARSLLEQALSIAKTTVEPDDELIGLSLNNLAILAFHEGDYQSAIILIQTAISIHKKVLGAYHPQTQLAVVNLYEMIRQLDE
jgi:tetratricopeptide (TPR) repeat protein